MIPDPLHDDFTHIRQVYFESSPNYEGRFTVPVLYDKKQQTIVNNESSEILRMFGTVVSLVGADFIMAPMTNLVMTLAKGILTCFSPSSTTS